jgi:hypothetical protein
VITPWTLAEAEAWWLVARAARHQDSVVPTPTSNVFLPEIEVKEKTPGPVSQQAGPTIVVYPASPPERQAEVSTVVYPPSPPAQQAEVSTAVFCPSPPEQQAEVSTVVYPPDPPVQQAEVSSVVYPPSPPERRPELSSIIAVSTVTDLPRPTKPPPETPPSSDGLPRSTEP